MKAKVSEARLAACDLIREAFAGVRLEDGVGLTEARGLDDYVDKKTLEACRRDDERDDWSVISAEKLQRYCDTLSFFDPKGMRFHLPAFMIAELRAEVSPGAMFHVSQLSDWSKQKFEELSSRQRQAVRAYLLALKDDPEFGFDRPHIEAALVDYWNG